MRFRDYRARIELNIQELPPGPERAWWEHQLWLRLMSHQLSLVGIFLFSAALMVFMVFDIKGSWDVIGYGLFVLFGARLVLQIWADIRHNIRFGTERED